MAAVQPAPSTTTPTTSFEYQSLKKVQDIPVVRDSLGYAHETLSKNPYTSYVYSQGLNFSTQAYEYSKPVQARLQPLLVRADTIAASGIDAVESRFPYPFKTPTEEIFKPVKDASDHAYSTFDARVRQPAAGFAGRADQSLSPLVDQLEIALNKIAVERLDVEKEKAKGATVDDSQLKRAYRLSVTARDQLVLLSSEQFKQLQQHNALVQRAIDTVYRANESLSSATKETNTKIHQLSDRILAELQKIQASTAALPGAIQSSTKPLSSQLSQIVGELQAVIKSEGSASQKASNVASTVQNQVGPILEAFKETYGNLSKNLSNLGSQTSSTSSSPQPTAGVAQVNGH